MITREGMATADNDRFLRFWYEVAPHRTSLIALSAEDARKSGCKWFPYMKGGEFRRYYGNIDYVVNWENDGLEIKNNIDSKTGRIRSHNYNGEFAFKEGVTWSALSSGDFSLRYCPAGFLFDSKGAKGFFNGGKEQIFCAIGFLNSSVAKYYLSFIAPTMDYKVGDVIRIPYNAATIPKTNVGTISEQNVILAKHDWDSFETSWDFKRHPLVFDSKLKEEYRNSQWATDRIEKCSFLKWIYQGWESECQNRFNTLKVNEEELNRIFIDIYGLQDELTPEVEDKDVTVRLANKERDIKSLISYLIGIVMGRYSLDVDGLAYAGGNWDASKYITYQPDDDGIVPIYTTLGMEDSLTSRVIELIKLIYGPDFYRHNIDFIAEALGKNNNESSEETLNRYLNDGFYTDHLKIYQKRPIYWMFSSGKYSGFKCLVYMHRYTEDTLALINGKYFLPESTRLKNDMEDLNNRINSAEGRDKIRLEKERQKLAASYNEAIEYGQVLDHMANKYIAIDLDDGVKVNYAKFQSVELVTDSGTKVKKDLLVPIK